jgi:membrane-associated phospholipid phosphatase
VLVAYVLIMAFTLVYTAEHYVIDILLGWALAVVTIVALNRHEARRARRLNAP